MMEFMSGGDFLISSVMLCSCRWRAQLVSVTGLSMKSKSCAVWGPPSHQAARTERGFHQSKLGVKNGRRFRDWSFISFRS